MASSVFFKFKSQKEPSRVEFDGTGISVFELKRDIIVRSGLGDGTDFDLAIYNEDGSIEYEDDLEIIPRSTLVIARRLPPIKPGAGRAARYMSGKAPVNAKNTSRKEPPAKPTAVKPATTNSGAMESAMTEEERMAAMFQQQSELWSAQQEEMSHQTPVYRPGGKKPPPANVPDHEPPLGYVCFRCGQKGHWIQVCPTNDDPAYDNKPRVKRTTGIPRSFLKTVAKPTDDNGDDAKPPSGVMVNADGEFVIAEPDKASWDKYQAKAQSSVAAQKAADLGEKELQEKGLECSIDKRMFIDPMKTPCCAKTYCNECITNALIESDFTCPGCQSDGVLIDNLLPDEEMSVKIKEYLEEKENGKKEKSPEVEASNEDEKSPSPPKDEHEAAPSPPATTTTTTTEEQPAQGQKRPAEDVLENPKIPTGPKAMQQSQQGPNMGNFPMMPAMPFDMMNNQFGMGMNPMMYGGGMNYGMPMMGYGNGMFGNGMNYGMPMNGMNGMNMGSMNMGAAGNMNMNMNFPPPPKHFQNQAPNEEDNAYFRQPVNPHRHQSRQRRVRPSDYREL